MIQAIPRLLTDDQLAELERNQQYRVFGDKCPVCLGKGEFLYKGERHECPDDDYGHPMLRLAQRYWLANLGLQYQRLNWVDYPHPDCKPDIESYIEQYDHMRLAGIGITLSSPITGVGKTWAATYVLKELVKRGVNCWFVNAADILGLITIEDYEERSFRTRKILGSELLVIDDIKAPYTQRQTDYHGDKLEEVVRQRTDNNFPTIVTTNMTENDLIDTFPRIHSLLWGKNMLIELRGEDARADGKTFDVNVKTALKGETCPIW